MKISVVIVTYNRAKHLDNCLHSLSIQTELPDELIIVDGGSEDDTKEIVSKYKDTLDCKFVISKKHGIAGARNIGVKNATADIIAFTDDDCIVSRNWIKNMIKYHEMHPECGAIGGKTLNAHPSSVIARVVHRVSFTHGDVERYVQAIPTDNVSYKANALKNVGLFDESLVTCEDDELNWRISQKYKILYVPKITVIHNHPTTFRKFLTQQYNYGRGFHQSRDKWKEWEIHLNNNVFKFLINRAMKLRRMQGKEDWLLLPFFIIRELAYIYGVMHEKWKKNFNSLSKSTV